jgi:hypothetical protein
VAMRPSETVKRFGDAAKSRLPRRFSA